ncbi:MAG: restriction endonuclease subunit S [Azoarcus sp.]|jgi:type I restriction enzyme S subunit|nr:restriction endonuclease subunit S [Azoarcus sp.]
MTKLDRLIAELCPNGVEYESLKNVCLDTETISWANNNTKIFRYIDLTSVDRETHLIVDTAEINSESAPSRAQKIVEKDDVIFGTTRPTLKRYCFITDEYDGQICSTGYCVLRANNDLILPRYIYHQISTEKFNRYVEESQRGAAYPAISDGDIKKFKIPLPHIKIQQEIVRMLDAFTELQARITQYEYYRNNLLSFGVVERERE